MAFLQESKIQQIEKAIKSNERLIKKADTMLREKNVDKKFQRFLIEDKKRLLEDRKTFNRMLNQAKQKSK